jgi:hypothetical protein
MSFESIFAQINHIMTNAPTQQYQLHNNLIFNQQKHIFQAYILVYTIVGWVSQIPPNITHISLRHPNLIPSRYHHE